MPLWTLYHLRMSHFCCLRSLDRNFLKVVDETQNLKPNYCSIITGSKSSYGFFHNVLRKKPKCSFWAIPITCCQIYSLIGKIFIGSLLRASLRALYVEFHLLLTTVLWGRCHYLHSESKAVWGKIKLIDERLSNFMNVTLSSRYQIPDLKAG